MLERFYGLMDIAEPTFNCSLCGAKTAEEQSKFHLCEKCEHEALKRFKFFLCNEFTNNEREYLDTCTEGISLTEPEKIKDVKAVYC